MGFLRDGRILYLSTAVLAAAVLVLAYAVAMVSQPEAEAEAPLSRVLVTKTTSLVQDPAIGHESHQVAMFFATT